MPGPAVQVSQVQGLGELPGVHGRGSDVADLPGPDRVVQRLQGFLDRGVVVPAVDLVQVDVVGPQSLQGGVELGEDRLAGQPGAVRAGAHPHPATRARRPGPARRSSCSRAEPRAMAETSSPVVPSLMCRMLPNLGVGVRSNANTSRSGIRNAGGPGEEVFMGRRCGDHPIWRPVRPTTPIDRYIDRYAEAFSETGAAAG